MLDARGDMMARTYEVFPQADDPDAKANEVRSWLATKGVGDFEPVSLFCDKLTKVICIESLL